MSRPEYKTIGIAVDRRRLASSETHAYYVRVGNSAKIHAYSEADATALAEKIRDALLEHTTENPDITFGF